MKYVVNEVGEGATDAVEATCEQEAAETFAERLHDALGSEFPKDGILVCVREGKNESTWKVGIDWSPTFYASENQESEAA